MQGISIDFLDSGFQATITAIEISVKRDGIETTSFADEALTSLAKSFHEVDEIGLEIHFDADSEPPIEGNAEPVLINWGTKVWLVQSFVAGFQYQISESDLMRATMQLKGVSTLYFLETEPVENDASIDCISDGGALIYAG